MPKRIEFSRYGKSFWRCFETKTLHGAHPLSCCPEYSLLINLQWGGPFLLLPLTPLLDVALIENIRNVHFWRKMIFYFYISCFRHGRLPYLILKIASDWKNVIGARLTMMDSFGLKLPFPWFEYDTTLIKKKGIHCAECGRTSQRFEPNIN